MNNDAFTYDYVSLPPDKQIGKHAHATWELAFVICGNGMRTIGDKIEPITEGEVILIPPHIPHLWVFNTSKTDADGNISNIAVFFTQSTLEGIEILFPEVKPAVYHIKSLSDAISYTGERQILIQNLLYSMQSLTPESRLPKMLEMLLLIADTDNCPKVGRINIMTQAELRLEKIRVFCACNHERCIRLDEVASHVGMNKSAFCTFMRRHTGTTFSGYINSLRLEKAVELLKQANNDIAEIAYSVGFNNVTYFNRLFKSKYGCSPKNMRVKNKVE